MVIDIVKHHDDNSVLEVDLPDSALSISEDNLPSPAVEREALDVCFRPLVLDVTEDLGQRAGGSSVLPDLPSGDDDDVATGLVELGSNDSRALLGHLDLRVGAL